MSEAGYSREKTVIGYTPDGIPITPENKFDDAIYNYLYAYWKEHSGEYDPKKDVIPESEMNKMHPKTKNEFQFEQWLFEQYGMTSKEKTENTLMGNLNVLLEVSDVIDIAALPVGAIAVGAKLFGKKIGKKVIKEVGEELGEKAVKEVAGETVEKTMKKEAAEEAVEKTVKTEVSEGVTETTTKKELSDTAEDLSQKNIKKENALEDSSGVKEGSQTLKSGINSIIKNGRISIDDLKANPSVFSGKSVDEIAQALKDAGYDVTIQKSAKSKSGAQIIKINNPGGGKNISQVQVSPGGGRHGSNPYVKISTIDQGIIKIVDGLESLYKTDGKETATIIFSGGN